MNDWPGQADELAMAVFSAMAIPLLVNVEPVRGIISREATMTGDYSSVTETLRWKLCVLRSEVPALPRNTQVTNPATGQAFRVEAAAESDELELAVWLREAMA